MRASARATSSSTQTVRYIAPSNASGSRPPSRLIPLLAKNFGRGRDREPAVEVARCALHSATSIAAHPDWRAALAVRDGSDHRVLKLPAPIPTDRLSGPEGTAQPHAFENPPNPFFERYADCGEFGVDAREIRTDTNAEYKPPLADLVEGRRLMRELHRVSQRRQQHARAQRHPLRPPRDPGQHHQRLMRGRSISESPIQIESKPSDSARSANCNSGTAAGLPCITRSRVGSKYPTFGPTRVSIGHPPWRSIT